MNTKPAKILAGITLGGAAASLAIAFAVGAYAEKPEPVKLQKDHPACDVTDKINRQPCEAVKPQ